MKSSSASFAARRRRKVIESSSDEEIDDSDDVLSVSSNEESTSSNNNNYKESVDLSSSSPAEKARPHFHGAVGQKKCPILLEDSSSDSEADDDSFEKKGNTFKLPAKSNHRSRHIVIDDSSDDSEEESVNDDESDGETLNTSESSSEASDSDRPFAKKRANGRSNVEDLTDAMANKLDLTTPDGPSPDMLEKSMRSLRVSDDASHSTKRSSQSSAASSVYYTPVKDEASASKKVERVPESGKNKEKLDDEFDDCAWALNSHEQLYFLSKQKYAMKGVKWPDLCLPSSLYERLYSHQKAGVQWMASLHSNRIGGILGDDMGLGKTFQTLSYLGGLMKSQSIRNALVVAPVSVLQSWEKEAHDIIKKHCAPRCNVVVVSSDINKRKRLNFLLDAQEW